jgi:hypothetical protein
MLIAILSTLALLAWSVAADCSRSTLQEVAKKYLDTISQDGFNLTLANTTIAYTENYKAMDIRAGALARAIKIAHNRTLLDSPGCAIYVEIIATDNKPQYHIGTQIHPSGSATEIETIVSSDQSQFRMLLNPTGSLNKTLKEEKAGGRSVIANAKRDSRGTLKQAADDYLDLYNNRYNNESRVQFAPGCTLIKTRYQGVVPCTSQIPRPQDESGRLVDRRYVIDETVGTVEVFTKFKSMWVDAYDFRIERGKIRYIHIISGGDLRTVGDPMAYGAQDIQGAGLGVLIGLGWAPVNEAVLVGLVWAAGVSEALKDGFASLIGVRGSRKGTGRGPKGV